MRSQRGQGEPADRPDLVRPLHVARRVAKWNEHAGAVLEPGEQVVAAATGTTGGWLFWLLPEISWFRDHARAYLVTDRNVYVCRLSSTRQYDVQGVLEKRALGTARVELNRSHITLDGSNSIYVGLLPIGRRRAHEVVDAATVPKKGSP
jgi:hypothetical protein